MKRNAPRRRAVPGKPLGVVVQDGSPRATTIAGPSLPCCAALTDDALDNHLAFHAIVLDCAKKGNRYIVPCRECRHPMLVAPWEIEQRRRLGKAMYCGRRCAGRANQRKRVPA